MSIRPSGLGRASTVKINAGADMATLRATDGVHDASGGQARLAIFGPRLRYHLPAQRRSLRMSATSEPVGTLETALAHTQRLLTSEPRLAAEQATEILKVAPGHPLATLLLGVAHRRSGDAAAVAGVLEPLAQSQPNWAAAHYELGLTLGARRNGEGAVAALRRAVSLKPEMPDAWRALGDHLTAIGDASGADDAYAHHIKYLDARPAPDGSGGGAVREPDRRRRVAAARASEAASDGRAGDAHAGGSRSAPRTAIPMPRVLLERCAGARAELHCRRATTTRSILHRQRKAAAALAAGRGSCSKPIRSIPSYRNAEGRDRSAASATTTQASGAVCRRARRVSAQRQGLDELRPCAEDRESPGRLRADVSQEHRARAASRRGVLEPREPEDLQVRGRRTSRRCSAQLQRADLD